MVPFGTLLANDHGAGLSLQFGEPQYHSWEDSPCSPAKSRLDSRDFITIPLENIMIRDPYDQDEHEFDCGLPSITRDSNYSLEIDDCERGCSSLPMSLPLRNLTADESSNGKQSLPITESSRVAFSKQVECFQIDTLDSYSQEEYDAMWYTPEETQSIRRESVKTLKVMLGEAPLEQDDVVCFRGLEYKAGHPFQARQSRKALTRNSVLDEQALNKDLKVYNPEAIAEVSRQRSAPSVAAAIEAAHRDHTQDCDQWMYYFDEDEWTFSNEIAKVSWLHAALPIAPKLSYFKMLRSNHRTPITV
ncbi:unnamed protein product [Cylindrotheca closterium]|uniref:Uncharacterized protein n=1 Tax=Cylindrotheca closterium TaxID=2856 RepID=A0AAD2G5A9_9STRA|nr:unnamed protein product [Cylindrotheca closterium]